MTIFDDCDAQSTSSAALKPSRRLAAAKPPALHAAEFSKVRRSECELEEDTPDDEDTKNALHVLADVLLRRLRGSVGASRVDWGGSEAGCPGGRAARGSRPGRCLHRVVDNVRRRREEPGRQENGLDRHREGRPCG